MHTVSRYYSGSFSLLGLFLLLFAILFVQQAWASQDDNQTSLTTSQYSEQSTNNDNAPTNSNSSIVSPLDTNNVTQSTETPRIGVSGTEVTQEIAEAMGLGEASGFLVVDITT